VNTPAVGDDSEGEESQIRRDLNRFEIVSIRFQRGMFWVAFLAFLVTVGYVYVSSRQRQAMEDANARTDVLIQQGINNQRSARIALETAQKQLKQSETSFAIEQRPWLVAHAPLFADGMKREYPIYANVTVTNIGKSPALEIAYSDSFREFKVIPGQDTDAAFHAFVANEFRKLRPRDVQRRSAIKKSGVEQDVAPIDYFFKTGQIAPHDNDEWDAIDQRKIGLVYVGIISYTDAFGGKFKTEFCYSHWGKDSATWAICDSYNSIR
jgi:hypothetical protein